MTTTYHDNPAEKATTLDQLRQHRAHDQIVQGSYWTGNGEGRGCAVGCLTHDPSGGHDQFPDRWGVPIQLAYVIDHIFESLPIEMAVDWPVRVMDAIPVGVNLDRVYDRWCHWMLTRAADYAGANRQVVDVMASLFERAGAGDEPTEPEWAWAAGAAGAAWEARAAGAAWAARAAEAAWAARAARAAEAAREARAARAAWAARAAEAAEAAEAAWAARAARAAEAAEAARAAEAAWAAWAAARNTWAAAAADELVRLVSECV